MSEEVWTKEYESRALAAIEWGESSHRLGYLPAAIEEIKRLRALVEQYAPVIEKAREIGALLEENMALDALPAALDFVREVFVVDHGEELGDTRTLDEAVAAFLHALDVEKPRDDNDEMLIVGGC